MLLSFYRSDADCQVHDNAVSYERGVGVERRAIDPRSWRLGLIYASYRNEHSPTNTFHGFSKRLVAISPNLQLKELARLHTYLLLRKGVKFQSDKSLSYISSQIGE